MTRVGFEEGISKRDQRLRRPSIQTGRSTIVRARVTEREHDGSVIVPDRRAPRALPWRELGPHVYVLVAALLAAGLGALAADAGFSDRGLIALISFAFGGLACTQLRGDITRPWALFLVLWYAGLAVT